MIWHVEYTACTYLMLVRSPDDYCLMAHIGLKLNTSLLYFKVKGHQLASAVRLLTDSTYSCDHSG